MKVPIFHGSQTLVYRMIYWLLPIFHAVPGLNIICRMTIYSHDGMFYLTDIEAPSGTELLSLLTLVA